ncbi:unnamed protein product [Moneuplotes crassus]|uniref:Uncharacterized protein n=1 Tax=Euplotes crassus TaxID=5936 RepID=A0AAD1UFA5_EUPCR|nr:unnamed protein product [Moneuplotes crassus]
MNEREATKKRLAFPSKRCSKRNSRERHGNKKKRLNLRRDPLLNYNISQIKPAKMQVLKRTCPRKTLEGLSQIETQLENLPRNILEVDRNLSYLKPTCERLREQLQKACASESLGDCSYLKTKVDEIKVILDNSDQIRSFTAKSSREDIRPIPNMLSLGSTHDKKLGKFLNKIQAQKREINALKERISRRDKKIAMLERKIQENNKIDYVLEELDTSNPNNFNLLVQTMLGIPFKISPSSTFSLDLSNTRHHDLIDKVNDKVPDVGRLDINNLGEDIDQAKKILKSNMLGKIDELSLNEEGQMVEFHEFGEEFEKELAKVVCTNVCKSFSLSNYKIQKGTLSKLLYSAAHLPSINLRGCKLETSPIPALENKDCSLTHLDLSFCGSPELGNWGTNPTHFDNLLHSLCSLKGIRNTLKKITMHMCGLDEKEIREILNKYRFNREISILAS